MSDPRIERLARLAVEVGANVQPDQVVSVSGRPGQEELVRAVASAAYARGARYVDVAWFDPEVKLARLTHAPAETLDWVPPWLGQRIVEIGRMAGATIALAGPTAPGLFDDVDPARAGRDRLPSVREGVAVIMGGQVNWTVRAVPQPGLGRPRVPRPGARRRARAPLDRGGPHLPPGRARPRRRLARARRRAGGVGPAPQRRAACRRCASWARAPT